MHVHEFMCKVIHTIRDVFVSEMEVVLNLERLAVPARVSSHAGPLRRGMKMKWKNENKSCAFVIAVLYEAHMCVSFCRPCV